MGKLFKKIWKRIAYFFKWIYHKLARINDSPQKVAQGLGLGVFLGIFPGAGPIAALVLSSLFRMNKAAALLGSLLTNTWISVAIFLPAIKVGAIITGTDRESIRKGWVEITTNFHWADLLKVGMIDVIFPVFAGYVVVALGCGVLAYLIGLAITKNIEKQRKRRTLKGDLD